MLKNTNIGARLAIGFSFVLLLLVIVSFFFANKINSLTHYTDMMFNHPLTVSNAVLRIDGNITKIELAIREVALAQNDQEIASAVTKINEYEKIVYQDLNLVTERFLGDSSMYQYAQTAFAEWKPIRDKIITLMRQGNQKQAFILLNDINIKQLNKIDHAIADLNNYAQNKAKTFKAEALATRNKSIFTTSALALLALLIGIVFTLYLTQGITQPLAKLINAVQDISAGNFEKQVNLNTRDEIGQLAQAFNQMSAKLHSVYHNMEEIITRRTEELESSNVNLNNKIVELKRSKEDLLLHAQALDNMLEGVFLVNVHNEVFLYTNSAFDQMFGYSRNDLLGKHVSILNAPSQRSPVTTTADIIAQLETTGEWEGELENIKKDGTIFWTRAKISVFDHSELGKIGISVQEDITDRKQHHERINAALAEKETLLRELYHRTKNNMQVIRSIISLQRAYSNNQELEQIFQETENKIQAMALVHQKLYQSKDLSKINLAEYFTELVELIFSSHHESLGNINTKWDMQDVFVLIDYAIPCGLVLNELLSNTLKHAFKNKKEGTIHIRLHKDHNGVITIDYKDDGIGVHKDFDIRQQKTLGLKTIITITEHQLQGNIDFNLERGFSCSIQFHDFHYAARV